MERSLFGGFWVPGACPLLFLPSALAFHSENGIPATSVWDGRLVFSLSVLFLAGITLDTAGLIILGLTDLP